MNRYAATRRDRHAALWVSLLLTGLVITALLVVGARIAGAVSEVRFDQTGQPR